jgi:hypothetical protein
VLLVEIAYWKPLEKVIRTKWAPDQVAKNLRESVTSGELAHWMGGIHSEAMEWCLLRPPDEEEDEVAFF